MDQRADHGVAGLTGFDPGSQDEGRIVPHVLIMATGQFRHPMAVIVLMKLKYFTPHEMFLAADLSAGHLSRNHLPRATLPNLAATPHEQYLPGARNLVLPKV